MSPDMVSFKITIKVTALEEFHSGDGLGKGGVYDVGQQAEYGEDGRRLPIVRDDTVSGLLRDRCQALTENSQYRSWFSGEFNGIDLSSLLNNLFNYGFNDSLMVRSLRPTSESLQVCDDTLQPLFTLVSQTAINTEKRKAQQGTLRTLECGASGLELAGEVRGRAPKDQVAAAAKFLADGFRFLKRLGGGRRRGVGALETTGCTVELCPPTDIPAPAAGENDKPTSLLLDLEALEPLHVGARGQVANIMPCLDYIPGQTLLGAFRHEFRVEVADRLAKPNGAREKLTMLLDELSPASFGPAYPVPPRFDAAQGQPFPVPLSWQRLKVPDKSGTLVDLFQDDASTPEQDKGPKKRLDDHYFAKDLIYSQPRERVMRNRIDPETGRVKEDLFTTEYLPRGTRLVSEIRFPDAAACRLFQAAFAEWLEGDRWLGLGRSRKPVKISVSSGAVGAFLGAGLSPEKAPQTFVLHLVSDTVLLTDALTCSTRLEEYLKNSGCLKGYKLEQSMLRTREIHGYTPIGGLPGFPTPALEKGSTFLFQRDGGTEDEAKEAWGKLCHLAQLRNLGEGHLFGWGRFRLAQPGGLKLKVDKPLEAPEDATLSRREAILSEAREMIQTFKKEVKPDQRLSRSHWGRLNELVETDSRPIVEILKEVQGKFGERKKAKEDLAKIIDRLRSLNSPLTEPEQRLLMEALVRWARILLPAAD